MTPDGHWKAEVQGTPDEVRERLSRSCLRIRNLWFTSMAEQRAWYRATEPLYLLGAVGGTLELGPRLSNLQAARLAPVLRLELTELAGGRTRLEGRLGAPRFAVGLLGLWGLAMLIAGAATAVRLREGSASSPVELMAWAVITGGVAVGAWIGWSQGGATLRAALPELVRLAGDPSAGADDWS